MALLAPNLSDFYTSYHMGNTVSKSNDEKFQIDRPQAAAMDIPPLPVSRQVQRAPAPKPEDRDQPLLVVKRQSSPSCRPRAVTQPTRNVKTEERAPAQAIANNWRRSVDPYMRTVSCPQASPVIDFDAIPVLQPDCDSDTDSHPSPASLGNARHFENQTLFVHIQHSSPRLSYYGSVYDDHEEDFDFLPAEPAPPAQPVEPTPPTHAALPSPPAHDASQPARYAQHAPKPPQHARPPLVRRATSPVSMMSRTPSSVYSSLSVRSGRSQNSTRSEPVRKDSIDTGIPPRVPAHTIFNGRPTSMIIQSKRPRSKSDASSLPFEVYTRKCQLTSPSASPSLASRLAPQRSFSTQGSSSPDTATTDDYRFALDGYSSKAPLKVVNSDPAATRKFYIKSKALIALEQERLQEQFYARQF